ncbi:DUF58 domain-containing protein [Deinococcus multiflagellatus]|uniref:DUF58 domain-containing protein n=1 Tax=Deinococcus multiflagellatus TaxID=1656887 RepID=A0ABW1ZHG3_9DEIO|nr:DUF58 domain-containing protein [Deinococcus multiflagellatus]MBZ9714564.1 DUF58 domain-containing protein [Deinococcus multiflagellatus]
MNPLLAALLYLGLVGLVTLGLWALSRRPPAATLTRTLPEAAFEGQSVPLTVALRVRSRRLLRVRVGDPTPRAVVPAEPLEVGALHQGDTTHEWRTELQLNRRGLFVWPGATLQWADPLGLFWRSAPLPAPPTTLEVFPGTHGLRLPEVLRPLLSEGELSRSLGLDDPISLRGAREYVPGDPPGRVHWRLSARTGTLTVRELERTAASSLTVFVDTTGGGEVFADSAARLGASLVQAALELNLPVAAASGPEATPSGRGPQALRAALGVLARLAPTRGTPQLPPVRAGGNLIILSAGAGPELVEQALRARATASRVSIVAIPEGFYLEPGEQPRRQWSAPPDTVRALEQRAAALSGLGVLVYVLRGNQSVLHLNP